MLRRVLAGAVSLAVLVVLAIVVGSVIAQREVGEGFAEPASPPTRGDGATGESLIAEAAERIARVPAGAGRAEEVSAPPPPRNESAVRARFVDAAGTPIPGAELALAGHAREVTSGADGSARLPIPEEIFAVGKDRIIELEARARGFALEVRGARVRAGETTNLGEWRLIGAGSVAGRVLDEDGQGLAGATVARAAPDAVAPDWPSRRADALEDLAEPGSRAASGLDGAFLLEDLPAGETRLVAVLTERPAALSAPFVVMAGSRVDGVVLRMEARGPGTSIAGRVTDPAGAGVPYARVVLRSARTTIETRSDASGRFEEGPFDQPCDVTAFDPEGRLREARAANVRPGTRGLELRLTRGSSFELAARSPEGTPIERFSLRVLAAERGLELSAQPDEARPGGLALVPVPGRAFLVEVAANGWRTGRIGPLSPDAPPARAECTLEPAGGVSGVVEVQGEPFDGAWVSLYEAVSWATLHNGFPVRRRAFPVAGCTSGPGGEFSLSVTDPGSYYLRAEAGGFAATEIGPLDLDPASERSETLTLTRGGDLEVAVRSSGGASTAGAIVALTRGDACGDTARAGDDGTLSFDLLMPGRWWVGLVDEELDPRAELTTESREPPAEIPWNCEVFEGEVTRVVLWSDAVESAEPRLPRLTGRLTIDGAPARDWLARLDVGRASSGAPEPFAEPGLFRLSAPEPGEYRLFLTTSAAEPSSMLVILDPVELLEGESAWSLDLRTGTLAGTLHLPPDATPDSTPTFYLWERGDLRCLAPIVPDSAGKFRCARVPAGHARIVRYDPARGFDETSPETLATIDLPAGETRTIEIR